ncbi:polysaccharide deacetylase family protein [Tepidamorphus sp. 3E244]|uniref:polysaccharide deacetylase family protein n=1 Tax=Tepidamorphus sp. 3E244 TaxID=3385498 RepID=UPI0038FD0878
MPGLLSSMTAGRGVIFTLHHVVHPSGDAFQPNRLLEISPDFLRKAILRIRARGYDIVHLGEVAERLKDPKSGRFCVLTFDDGYRDNLEIAYPVLKELDCPFTVYVATSMPDGTAELWWRVLEIVVASRAHLELKLNGTPMGFPCETPDEKYKTYEAIYWWLRSQSQDDQRSFIRDLAMLHDIDMASMVRRMAMSWDEVSVLARDSLCTIGAHTVKHFALARIDADRARAEMLNSADILESYLPERPKHFAYPYGDPGSASQREFEIARECGFETAVTTRPGVLFTEHLDHMYALPRISLNGEFQAKRYLDGFLSGVPSLAFNKGRKLNIA